jgi:hypothetical protein
MIIWTDASDAGACLVYSLPVLRSLQGLAPLPANSVTVCAETRFDVLCICSRPHPPF